jgi:CRISPR-associated protein Csb2
MRHAEEQPPPEVLAGHTPDGRRSERPHVAFLALPSVGHPHADGTLLGLAIVVPRALAVAERRRVYRACAQWEQRSARRVGDEARVELWMGRAGAFTLRRRTGLEAGARNLDPDTWVGPPAGARAWGSVTPVVLDRFPGNLWSRYPGAAVQAYAEAQETVAAACLRLGLPRPHQVEILAVSPVRGAPSVHRFPPFSSHAGDPARVSVHVRLAFPEPVRGPILLGAGRYRGMGLCRPLLERGKRP